MKSLSRHFFALAIIVAISGLPALYAWVNIYANGNPYANTGEIKIALASRDPGIDLEDGTHINMADEVFEEMKGNNKIGWQFPGSAEEAIEGVKSGEYYAAVIFEDNFTYNMYHFEQALLDDKAPLKYYENGKVNAIAPKITETAAGNLQESIKTKYLETVFGFIFDETNDLADKLAEGNAAEAVIAQLRDLRDTLRAYDSIIDAFTGKSSQVHEGLANAGTDLDETRKTARKSADDAAADLDTARRSLVVLKTVLEVREKRIEKERAELERLIDRLTGGGLTDAEKEELEKQTEAQTAQLKNDLESMLALFPESGGSAAIEAVRATLINMITVLDTLQTAYTVDPATSLHLLNALKILSQESLSESVGSLISALDNTLDLLEPLMGSISVMLDDLDPVMDSADDAVSALDSTLVQLQKIFRATADRVDDIIAKVEAAEDDEKLQLLIDILGGDPEEYARFFSSLVNVEVEEVYSVASYGAAMAPFYSVLAIWVGGVILVSILKTHIDRKRFPDATEAEAFFGRFILFFLVGQAQAAIIVAGDIYLLGCDPVHPGLMYLAASVTSFVFVMLIYALTLSFGDIGKAMVVVVMVLQIAGSSGSYPIEILPVVFGKIYKFFPFPYAINAMREALCGKNAYDYQIYLGELLVFAVLALAIGLFVRKPFIKMNNFVSEKIEETEVL